LDSDCLRNRLVAPDHLGAVPYLAIEQGTQSPLLTDYTPAPPGRQNRRSKARAQAAAQRDADRLIFGYQPRLRSRGVGPGSTH
jgi:hypothetical protein